jgi:hypothetical protein
MFSKNLSFSFLTLVAKQANIQANLIDLIFKQATTFL